MKGTTISPAHQRLLTMLIEADGAFVRGGLLAAGAGIQMDMLSGWMRAIRIANPDIVIESKHGSGYRIASSGLGSPVEVEAPNVATIKPSKPGFGIPLHRRMAANMAILDLLPAKTAELVKLVAADAGEDIDATLHRLISYGVEVHNDLLLAGENPIGLRRQPMGSKADQVWQ